MAAYHHPAAAAQVLQHALAAVPRCCCCSPAAATALAACCWPGAPASRAISTTTTPSSSSSSSSTSSSSSASASSASGSSQPFQPPPPLPNRRVVFTGLGLVTPLGVGVQASWEALVAGHTGTRALQPEDLPDLHRHLLPQLPCRVAALVPRAQLQQALELLEEDGDSSKRSSLFMQYALLAAREALQDAGWQPATAQQRAATGVAIGSGMSSCGEVVQAWETLRDGKLRRISPYFVPRILPNMAAGAVGIKYGLNGPNHSASTACATGIHSIGDAYRMIQRGDADVMVAGASEACVDALSLAGFSRLKALTVTHNDRPEAASRPFDAGRDGFVMGEGAGCVVLEAREHAEARGARMYAEVRGYGLSGDGHHITQPHPQGLGPALAMARALRGSGLQAEHVAYVNAHATSTPLGDEAEQVAVLSTLGSEHGRRVAVSSTKGATGHLLGAAGAVETVFTVLALHSGIAPPTANLEHPTPHLLQGLVHRAAQPLAHGPKAALCNSFGFGGTNASLLIAKDW